MKWEFKEVRARFSEFLNATLKAGPQVVTHCGIDTAVLMSIEEWNRLQRSAKPSLKRLLVSPEPRIDRLVPQRGKLRRR